LIEFCKIIHVKHFGNPYAKGYEAAILLLGDIAAFLVISGITLSPENGRIFVLEQRFSPLDGGNLGGIVDRKKPKYSVTKKIEATNSSPTRSSVKGH
jgi:hypothetical protein